MSEIADFVEVSQFQPGRSAYECVAYSAALCYYAGQLGHGARGSAQQVIKLAQYWYSRLEGNDGRTNTNGMSLQAEYTMLNGLGLKYQSLQPSVARVKDAINQGYPVMLCAAETSMYDLDLGDRIPYSWPPSGNHCIVVSGIASDGNLLVRDTANIGPTGLRPDPRRYDASRLQIVSATAIQLPFSTVSSNQSNGDELSMLSLTDPIGQHFTEIASGRWHCKETGVDLVYALLSFYRMYGGLLRLPLTNELYLKQYPDTAIQVFEGGIAAFDPKHIIDAPAGAGPVYLLKISEGIGQQIIAKPLLAELQAQVTSLENQLASAKAEVANKPDVSALETELASAKAAFNSIEAVLAQQKGKVY